MAAAAAIAGHLVDVREFSNALYPSAVNIPPPLGEGRVGVN
jgi:hypothetical protein